VWRRGDAKNLVACGFKTYRLMDLDGELTAFIGMVHEHLATLGHLQAQKLSG